MKSNKEFPLLLKKSLLFLVILLIILFSINELYISYVLPKTYISRSEESYANYLDCLMGNGIQNAFFGDSHVVNAINPEYIPNTFNFGTPGENYIKTYYRLERILDNEDVVIKRVFIQLDFHSFSSYMNGEAYFIGDSLWYYHKLIPLQVIQEISKKSFLSLFIESKFPVIGNAAHFSYIFNGKPIEVKKGWVNHSGDFSRNSETQRIQISTMRFNQLFVNEEIIDLRSKKYFKKIINLSKEHNVTLFFVRYPISSYFYERVINNFSEKNFEIDFNQKNFLDYGDLFLENPEFFTDSDHLNYLGAENISRRITSDLNLTL
ncbi:MAG: hypothetical protein U9Q06_00835 [Nanoarchaeota archaeon]|nr:hypothetical protein [Nanoarchaeota archaeon]